MMSSWLFPSVLMLMIMFYMSLLILSNNHSEVCILLSKSVMDLNFSFSSQNMLFFISILIISLLVFFWGLFYMMGSEKLVSFFLILFLFVVSMLVLVLSNSLLTIFLGWEGLGLTSFLLIIFYQNWMSFQGGLLTLMTNRLGDAILMISYSYWIIQNFSLISFFMSSALLMLFITLTLTKSAQVPFTSWLPAAMAAPTPVSALVHSSTLVTAGVWLVIKFGNSIIFGTLMWFIFGGVTLLVASLAALMESDAKKVVALSTLSQLGLMYLALYMGGSFITLFHLLMHAFAKANLFLMVGNMIHSRFSQQDIRNMSSGLESPIMLLMTMISLLSLIGMTYTSGFLSKDLILGSHYNVANGLILFLLVLSIITLTSAYCYNLFSKLLLCNSGYLTHTMNSLSSAFPSSVLSLMSLMLGWFAFTNMIFYKIMLVTLSGFYWGFILLSFLLLYKTKMTMYFFKTQLYMVIMSVYVMLKSSKFVSLKLSSSMMESVFLSYSLASVPFMLMVSRINIMLSIFVLLVLMV